MILTVAALILPLALLFFADLDTYIVTCAFLYGILLCYRYARNERSVLDMVFFFTYLIFSVLQTAIGIQRFVPFTGSVIYALLTAVFFLASTGMPLTTAASKTWQPEILLERSVGNGILAVMNGLALIFSLTLFPSVSYIIVPLVFTFASIPASIFLPPILIDGVMRLRARFIMSKEDAAVFKRVFGNIRGLVWVSDTLYAKEVWSESEREMFFSVLEKGYFSIYQKSKNPSKGTYAEFMNAIREEYAAFARRSSSFIVYDTRTQAPVGCIRIVLGGPAHGGALPLEGCVPVSLADLAAAVSCVAEAGRIVILPSGPLKAKVLELLVSLMIVKALLSRVRVIITDAMEGSAAIYEKMGLKRIAGPFFDTEFSQNSWLCAADIAALLGTDASGIWERSKSGPRAQKTIASYLSSVQDENRRLLKKQKPCLYPGDPIAPFIRIEGPGDQQ